MAKENFNEDDGVWRTVGGRRIFIRNGQNLADAMKESGKFKKAKDIEHQQRKINNELAGLTGKDKEKADEEFDAYEKLKKQDSVESKLDTKKEKILEKNPNISENSLNSILEDYAYDTLGVHNDNISKYIDSISKREEETPKEENKTSDTKSGKEYRDSLTKLKDKTYEDGTYDLDTGKPVNFGNKGYNVSFEQSSDNYSDEEYLEKIEECRKLCDGKVYGGKFGGDPEISFYTEDKDTALKIMEKYNQHSIYDNSIGDVIENPKYNAETNKVNYESKASNQNDSWLPKKTEIKEQGKSNRKEVSENIQAHILEYYDKPEDFVEQMDVFDNLPTKWHAGQEMAKQGFYDIYYDDQREFLNSLKINPSGKEFSDDKVFQTYTSLIGRESAKLYDKIKKHTNSSQSEDWVQNAFKEYMQDHPNSKMTLTEFLRKNKDK